MVATEAPARTRTRPSAEPPPRRGFLRRAGAAVLGLALCACAVYAQTLAMSYDQSGSNLTSHGDLGETVQTARFSVKATSVISAKAVDTRDYRGNVRKVQTSHLFLVIEVSATSPKEPFKFNAFTTVLVTADGKRYRTTDKVDPSLTFFNKWIQPGLWPTGKLIFEVPEEAVAGAGLVVASPGGGILVDSLAPEAEIDLGLTGATATRLTSGPEQYHSLAGT
ncbi:hypothetical protein Aph01nite_73660 [Acrocarpospora phusangensis]|uniref:DUF4352 domain-containing protein n=1 Tax=Acrocarpospora phusangensis TaxID=1070424 RepID=A0A919UNZ3_9ACTN|nr:DUF4352 domain-containing protein [Acrocarpospora phusangensis]GIH29056.1 hypothetical protein Aph01nite_73660 [Acrocarpospora phusangensis]